MHRLIINVTFNEEGIYGVRLKLEDSVISKGEFNMIALSRSEAVQVEKALGTRTATYETKLLSINGEKWSKNKKVFCAISPKQIALKEYILGIIPKRLATFRLCPATKVFPSIHRFNGYLISVLFRYHFLKLQINRNFLFWLLNVCPKSSMPRVFKKF